MHDVFNRKVDGRTYAAPLYGKEITLTVGEDMEGDAVASISEEAMIELGVSEGGTIEIIGAWSQKAKATILREGEITTIRIDERTRKALPVSAGQKVGVRKGIHASKQILQ
jgi:hypothetical protein